MPTSDGQTSPPGSTDAILVTLERQQGQARRALEELARLVEGLDLTPVAVLIQRRLNPDHATFLGKGKLRELGELLEETGAQTVVFNAELSPSQGAALREALDCEVLDRTEVILEIFARHAHSGEGKLQVDKARLEYLLPRLVGRGQEMSQIGGGRMAGGAIGVRGPGITRLEMDRRYLRRRLRRLDQRLEEVRARRSVERRQRLELGLPLVGLVGYTNAGKSSLLNALAGAEVVSTADRLFHTLDTTLRRVDLGEGLTALVSDTVGFLDRLPTHLISAFRATLEETQYADVLVEVLDAADPFLDAQRLAVNATLADLGVGEKPRLLALNKWDLLSPDQRRVRQGQFPRALPVSALTGEGLEDLRAALRPELSGGLIPLTLHLPWSEAHLLHFPAGQGVVLSREYAADHVEARVRVHPRHLSALRPYVVAEG